MSGVAPYYASLKLRDDDRIRAIREDAWGRLDPPDGYERSAPHLTVHPGFSCDHQTAARVAGVLAYTVGEEVEVESLGFFPDHDEPMVVKLDVSVDLSVYRQTIESHVLDAGGTVDRDPVPAHVTLFKSGDAGDDPDAVIEDPVVGTNAATEVYGGWTTEVSGYTVERRG